MTELTSVRAIQITHTGGPEVLELTAVPVGEPGAGEVRIRHEACGLNFIDTYHRSGLYALPLPAVLGVEAAGTIDAVGPGVTHLAVGDRVAYVSRSPGSYASARVVPQTTVVRLPATISAATAASVLLKGLTVQALLRQTRVELVPGDLVLWHAAAGGVGLIACQWAKALGLQLIGTAGSAAKCELARAHGAAHVIDYTTEDVVARVRALTGGKGVKVVFDSVGKDTWDRSLDCLQPRGVMVSFGNASGPVPPISLVQLMAKGSLYVTRPTLHTFLSSPEVTQQMADELFALIAGGQLALPAPRTYPLAEAARAHADLEGRRTTGASILIP